MNEAAPRARRVGRKPDGKSINRFPILPNERSKRFFATFAKSVYSLLQSERQNLPSQLGVQGYTYLPAYSDTNVGVWYSPSARRYVISFRGTDFTNIRDLLNDVGIIFGKSKYLPRVKTGVQIARKIVEKILKDNNKDTIEVTGHSLGGKVGLNVSIGMELNAYLFNIGSSPVDKPEDIALKGLCALSTRLGKCEAMRNIVHFHVVGDPISVSAANAVPWRVERQAPTTKRDPHTIDNFIPEHLLKDATETRFGSQIKEQDLRGAAEEIRRKTLGPLDKIKALQNTNRERDEAGERED